MVTNRSYLNTLAKLDSVDWLDKDAGKNKARAYDRQKGKAKRAVLAYELLASHGSVSLVKISPETGRPHQIRVQMKTIGCPIKGDLKYGYTQANRDKSINLHAFKLDFVHPVKKEPVTVTADPPNEAIWNLFSQYWE